MENTWPGGKRRALTQAEHEVWNAHEYPGTRQICVHCDAETDHCEEDAFYCEICGVGPLCANCCEEDHDDILKCISCLNAMNSLDPEIYGIYNKKIKK